MTTVILPEGKTVTTAPGTVEEILFRMGLNPYEVLVTSDGALLLGDEFCDDSVTLRLTSIVHGG